MAGWIGLVVVCVAGLLWRARLGDYTTDAGPAVAALAAGSFRRAAAVPFLMGPFSIVLRAPFAWLAARAGAGLDGVYRAGILPCLVAPGALGLALAREARRGRESLPVVVPLVAVLSPASVAAVRNGHPEEFLGGALCVAAVLLASRGRVGWAGLALGLAVATKQWALLAVVPALLATPRGGRRRLVLVGAVVAAAFYLPFVAENPQAFRAATRIEAHVESSATPETIWLVASHEKQVRLDGFPTLTYHATARWLPPVSHALIVLVALPLGFALRNRRLGAAGPLALLALLFLLRCVFDPVDQDYFHAPFVLALLAWEVRAGRVVRGLPLATLAAACCLWLTFGVLHHHAGAWLVDGVYLAWTGVAGAALLRALDLLPALPPRRVSTA